MAVNNCAGAVAARRGRARAGRRSIVSRGQLVEIGGGFRVPDVIAQAGARLVEVGTTNRTRRADYERAIGPDTGAILRAHPSNFRQLGFVQEVEIEELCELGVPVIDDVGSGVLADGIELLADEPPVRRSVAAGAALVCFSGDKLLGGPQAGLIVGRADAVARAAAPAGARAAARQALARRARGDAAAVPRPERRRREIPVLAMLTPARTSWRRGRERLAALIPRRARSSAATAQGRRRRAAAARAAGAGGRGAGRLARRARRAAARGRPAGGGPDRGRAAAARPADARRRRGRAGRPRRRRRAVSAPLTLGTAGHIDHGKTALIRALTGIDTDRLPEERRRGISIELGYAALTLPGGRRLSVVDVPGHERFVRTMVAGATGIDLFLMVVAADDGVMPQTREHAAVLAALGVDGRGGRGHQGRPRRSRAGAGRGGASCCPAPRRSRCRRAPAPGSTRWPRRSTASAAGLPRPGRRRRGPVRLHVDRAFTIRGAGTVVTGTLWSGTAARGDAVTLLPAGLQARVRGVQVHDRPVERAAAASASR